MKYLLLCILQFQVFLVAKADETLLEPEPSFDSRLPIRQPTKPNYNYVTSDYTVTETGACVDGSRVWVYTPALEKPGGADVVVYLHGYAIADPIFYISHIEHLVKLGNYVLFPQFQEYLCGIGQGFLEGLLNIFPANPAEWAVRAAESVQDALDTSVPSYQKLYLYGHSLGGAIGMMWGDLTSTQTVDAAVFASPQPAGFAGIPGMVTTEFSFLFGQDIDVPSAAPHSTFPVAVLHGSDDNIAPLEDIMPAYRALGSTEKEIYQAQTDTYGAVDLAATHFMPLTLPEDSLDWRYIWSGLDQVMTGTPVTGLVFDMGSWSDGQPVLGVVKVP